MSIDISKKAKLVKMFEDIFNKEKEKERKIIFSILCDDEEDVNNFMKEFDVILKEEAEKFCIPYE